MATATHEEYASRYNLGRFVDAHHNTYTFALKEIQFGKKAIALDVVYISATTRAWS